MFIRIAALAIVVTNYHSYILKVFSFAIRFLKFIAFSFLLRDGSAFLSSYISMFHEISWWFSVFLFKDFFIATISLAYLWFTVLFLFSWDGWFFLSSFKCEWLECCYFLLYSPSSRTSPTSDSHIFMLSIVGRQRLSDGIDPTVAKCVSYARGKLSILATKTTKKTSCGLRVSDPMTGVRPAALIT